MLKVQKKQIVVFDANSARGGGLNGYILVFIFICYCMTADCTDISDLANKSDGGNVLVTSYPLTATGDSYCV